MTEALVSRRWAQPATRPAATDGSQELPWAAATGAPDADGRLSGKQQQQQQQHAPSSFLRTLREVARQEDFVVVKLDVDGGPERQIATALAEIPELTALVDDFYFEWHYHFDGRDFGWGQVDARMNKVDDALALMQKLRRRGVRAHWWV